MIKTNLCCPNREIPPRVKQTRQFKNQYILLLIFICIYSCRLTDCIKVHLDNEEIDICMWNKSKFGANYVEILDWYRPGPEQISLPWHMTRWWYLLKLKLWKSVSQWLGFLVLLGAMQTMYSYFVKLFLSSFARGEIPFQKIRDARVGKIVINKM